MDQIIQMYKIFIFSSFSFVFKNNFCYEDSVSKFKFYISKTFWLMLSHSKHFR